MQRNQQGKSAKSQGESSALRVLIGMPEKDSWGGPTGCEPPFVAALRAAGVEVDEEVYVYGDNQARISALQRVWRVLRAAWRLRQRAKAGHYDVIHLNTSCDEKCILRDALTLACVRSSDASIFLKMHGSIAAFLADERKFWRYWKRRVFSQADAIGVLSTEEYLNFSRAGCPSEKLVAVKNASESETFQPDPQFRKLHGLKGKTPVLLFSSRLIRTKGLLDLIKACGHLRDASQDFSLFCLGDGPARNEAEDDVRKLGLTGFVKFFGNVPEAETVTFHANATIFVFPTYHDEGFPVVLLKSLAAGLPIITTRIRGAADYLKEPDNCLWVEPRNPSQLAEKIMVLLADKELREAMTVHNRLLAQQFTASRVAEEYIAAYKSIISKDKG